MSDVYDTVKGFHSLASEVNLSTQIPPSKYGRVCIHVSAWRNGLSLSRTLIPAPNFALFSVDRNKHRQMRL